MSTPTTDDRRNVKLLVAASRDPRPRYVIAAAANINPTVFSGIITGRLQASAAVQRRIADALGRTVEELFGACEVDT
jgi:hypothetical protein